MTEPEHKGSIWTHPYLVYVAFTLLLFLILLVLSWIGFKSGIVPERRI